MNAAGQFLQFGVEIGHAVDQVVDLLPDRLLLFGNRRLERAQAEAQRDDALLRAVV